MGRGKGRMQGKSSQRSRAGTRQAAGNGRQAHSPVELPEAREGHAARGVRRARCHRRSGKPDPPADSHCWSHPPARAPELNQQAAANRAQPPTPAPHPSMHKAGQQSFRAGRHAEEEGNTVGGARGRRGRAGAPGGPGGKQENEGERREGRRSRQRATAAANSQAKAGSSH